MATQLVLVQSLGVQVLPPELKNLKDLFKVLPRSSSGLGRQVLNLVTRVRIPYGVPLATALIKYE